MTDQNIVASTVSNGDINPRDVTPVNHVTTDWLHKGLNWLSYNRFTALAVGLAAITVSLSSCTFTAPDPVTGIKATKEVLAASLKAEADTATVKYVKLEADFKAALGTMQAQDATVIAKYQAAIDNVIKQEQTWFAVAQWVNQLPIVAGNPLLGSAIGLGGLLLAGGTKLDNSRKDKVITQLAS